jgi:phosphatidylglycerol lysyltransferase
VPNHQAIFDLVKKYGRTTTSLQILASNFQYWVGRDACVAYVEVGKSWVASGAAITSEERQIEAMEQFAEAARRRGRSVRFFGVERDISSDSSFAAVHIGDQPVWDPSKWQQSLGKSLREQLRRARAKGVTVRLASIDEIRDTEHPTRRGVDAVIGRWLESRKVAPMGFLIDLDPFHEISERRVFVAEVAGKVVGVIIAIPIYGRKGWLLDNLLRDPAAPNGTVELIFDCAMRTFAAEGSEYATFGLSPFVGVSSPLICMIRDAFGRLYNFKGLYAFKTKLKPIKWEPVYLAYPKRERGALAVFHACTAFLPGGWLRFAARSFVQRAATTSACLLACIVPFTALLAAADTRHWFPTPAIHAAWVLVSVMMTGALVGLSRVFHKPLALAASALAAASFVFGLVQAWAFNASRASGWEWAGIALALTGSLVTSIFLWSSRDRATLYARPFRSLRPALAPAALPAAIAPRAARASAGVSDPMRVRASMSREL